MLPPLLVLAASLSGAAAEPGPVPEWTAERLLEAVTQRGYHDTTLLILERLAEAPGLSERFRRTLPLRRAAALVATVRREPDLAKRQAVYAAAGREIDQLAAAGEEPAIAAEAAVERALLLLERARLARQQADDPTVAAAAAELYTEGLTALVAPDGSGPAGGSARTAVSRQLTRVNGELADYRDRRVLPRKDQRIRDALETQRQQLRGRLIQFQLLAAEATAERARCLPAGSDSRRSGLDKAVQMYRAIEKKQPTRAAGLWARVEAGRLLLELGARRQGLDELEEILKLPASEDLIERLQIRALAASLASWLETADQRDDAGLTAQFRRRLLSLGPPESLDADATAAKLRAAQLLQRRAETVPESDRIRRKRLVEDVRRLATDVVNAGGDDAVAAADLLRQLDNRGRAAARRLQQTYEAAVDRAGRALAAYESEPTEPLRMEAAKLVREALVAAGNEPPASAADRQQQLMQLRYQLAYLLYAGDRFHEAAALAEQLVMAAPAEPVSRKAATIALASWQALQRQPNDAWSRAAVGQLARLTELLMRQWPEDTESAAAAMLAIDQAAAAADLAAIDTILGSVSPANSDRLQVLLRGGVAIWQGCRRAAEKPDGGSRSAECRERASFWLDEALALAANQEALPAEVVPVAVAAAIARCEIALARGGDETALLEPLLTHRRYGPWTVLAEPRQEFAAPLVEAGLTCCLRGFTAAARYQPAAAAVAALRRLAAGREEVAVRLAVRAATVGRELVETLRSPADTAAAVPPLPGLGLLSELLAVAAADPAPLLATGWAAAVLEELGRGSGPLGSRVPPAKRRDFLSRAAVATERQLAAADQSRRPALWLRLASLRTAAGRPREAVALLEQVVSDSQAGRSVLSQREVARQLEEAAGSESDRAAACQLFRAAAIGRQAAAGAIWGWGGLAGRISKRAFGDDDDEALRLRELYFEARLRLASCRLAWADREADAATRRKLLRQAAAELAIEARLHPELGGPEYRQRFAELRRAIDRERDLPATSPAEAGKSEGR